jgi:hypothetical protein
MSPKLLLCGVRETRLARLAEGAEGRHALECSQGGHALILAVDPRSYQLEFLLAMITQTQASQCVHRQFGPWRERKQQAGRGNRDKQYWQRVEIV